MLKILPHNFIFLSEKQILTALIHNESEKEKEIKCLILFGNFINFNIIIIMELEINDEFCFSSNILCMCTIFNFNITLFRVLITFSSMFFFSNDQIVKLNVKKKQKVRDSQ